MKWNLIKNPFGRLVALGVWAALGAVVLQPISGAKPAGDSLALGEVQFKVNDTGYDFSGAAGALLPRPEGGYRFILSLADSSARAELILSADIIWPGALRLNSDYNSISMVLKTPNAVLVLSPAKRLAKGGTEWKTVRTGQVTTRKAPDWQFKSKAERFAAGQGVVDNRRLAGTKFYLQLIPVWRNGKIVEMTGTFSGLMRDKAGHFGQADFVTIGGGKFRVEVHTQ